jgi:hypothetical protein
MKTQSQKITFPQLTIIPDDGSFDFLKGKDFFAEKTARAKESLKNVKLPPR